MVVTIYRGESRWPFHFLVSEMILCVHSRLAVSKKPVKATRASKKAAKDPNKPKRPASAFFVFM